MKVVIIPLILAVAASAQAMRVVCYFVNLAALRSGSLAYNVSGIDPFKCTHLIYENAFYIIGPDAEVAPVYPMIETEPSNPNGQLYSKFVALKKQNPKLKTMISVVVAGFSALVSDTNKINTFVSAVVVYLKKYNFDGVDIHWEFPSSAADKAGFVRLLSALRVALGSTYLLSIQAAADVATVAQGYDVAKINSQVDFINLMEYNMHKPNTEPTKADHHAPLYKRSWDTNPNLNVNASVSYWISQGASPSKLNMGIPLYGEAWTLTSTTVAPPAAAKGAAGTGLLGSGYMEYYEICSKIGWTKVSDPKCLNGPYAYNVTAKQWVGFDDVAMVTAKTYYAMAKGLGGVMVWDIGSDDFLNKCGGGKNPLLSAISKTSAGFVCPQPGGYFANPLNCSSFYQCFNNVAFLKNCPNGLYFNPVSLTCDWPSKVNCKAW